MRFGFHPEARSEYKEATAFYEAQSRGLGNEFVQEIEATIKKIIQSPERWRFIE